MLLRRHTNTPLSFTFDNHYVVRSRSLRRRTRMASLCVSFDGSHNTNTQEKHTQTRVAILFGRTNSNACIALIVVASLCGLFCTTGQSARSRSLYNVNMYSLPRRQQDRSEQQQRRRTKGVPSILANVARRHRSTLTRSHSHTRTTAMKNGMTSIIYNSRVCAARCCCRCTWP